MKSEEIISVDIAHDLMWKLFTMEKAAVAMFRFGELVQMTSSFSQVLREYFNYSPIIGERLVGSKMNSVFHDRISALFNQDENAHVGELQTTDGKARLGIFYTGQNQEGLSLLKLTVNKIAEIETHKQLTFYEDILDNLPADLAVFDAQHRYIYTNKQAVKNPETREWIIGKDDFEFCERRGIPINIAEQRRKSFIETISGNGDPFLEEFKTINEFGQVIWKYRKYHPIFENETLKYVIGYGIDVSEMKNQRLRFLEIAHRLDEIIFQIDEQANILFLSNAFERITGFSASDFIGKNLEFIACDEDKPRLKENIAAFLSNNYSGDSLEFRMSNQNGNLVWVRIKFFCENSTILDPLLAGIIQNIDDVVKADAIIMQQRLAIENSVEGVGIMNANDQYTYLNKAHIEIFGYEDSSELLGKSWRVFYPEDEIERIQNDVFPTFLKNGYFRGTTKGLKKDGTTLSQEISLTILPDGGLICITHDVTEERKKAEELKRLAIVAERTNSIVIITDSKGFIQWVNESFIRIMGHSFSDVVGKSPEVLCGPGTDAITVEEIHNSIINGTPYRGEILNYTESGQPIWLYLDITPVFNTEGRLINFIAVESDITALKYAEENTLKALNKERQLNQFKSHFINLVSHEFRTPLATIKSSMDILSLQLDGNNQILPPAIKSSFVKHHLRISSEIDLMTEIMENILLMGRLDAGRMVFMPECSYLSEIIEGLINEIHLNPSIKRRINLNVIGNHRKQNYDRTQIRHIFTNLISNALKYSEGSVDPEVIIKYNEDSVILEVRDHGIGIPVSEIPHLFTSFYRASNTSNIQGTGLGLVIVKQLVEMHSGRIFYRKPEGQGSLFVVEFPNKNKFNGKIEEDCHH